MTTSPSQTAAFSPAPPEHLPTECATVKEVAQRLGISADSLAQWESLGLLVPGPHRRLTPRQIEHARLLQFIHQRGIPAETVAGTAARGEDLIGWFATHVGEPRPLGHPPQAVAAVAGLDHPLSDRLRAAVGLADAPELFDGDIRVLEALGAAVSLGVPEEALVQIVRVAVDAFARIAEAENRLFHFHVYEVLRASGLEGAELVAAADAVSEPLWAIIEPTLLHFHNRAWEHALREDLVMHLAADPAQPPSSEAVMTIAVIFIDLADFTGLTDLMGDGAAAQVLDTFSTLIRTAAAGSSGRIIKQIGDEFMIVFPTAQAAVRYGLDVRERARTVGDLPQLRIGAHIGQALYREGDYVGATVNIASRVTAVAAPGQFVVTRQLRDMSEERQPTRFVPLGIRQVRGVAAAQDLYLVH